MSSRLRNALVGVGVVALLLLTGAPLLVWAYPELRRVGTAPDWPVLAGFLALVVPFAFFAGFLREGGRQDGRKP